MCGGSLLNDMGTSVLMLAVPCQRWRVESSGCAILASDAGTGFDCSSSSFRCAQSFLPHAQPRSALEDKNSNPGY